MAFLNKPNVIIITLDGARIDRMKKFPNFMRLVSQSTLFSNAATYAPFTIGSMHAIFSGAYGYNNGVNCYYASKNFRENNFETIASYLKKEGYYTVADVLNLICVPKKGFDEFEEHNPDTDDLIKRHGALLARMKEHSKDGKNFFLFLHYTKIQNSVKINVSRKFNNFSEEYFAQKETNLKNYDSYAKEADDYLGSILELISSLGLENSLLIIHSDHGMGVGEKFGEKAYGAYCYDYTLKSFFLCRLLDTFPKKEIARQVRTIDILPTLLDYLNIPPSKKSEKIDGVSTRDMIESQDTAPERIAYAETGNPYPDLKIPPREPNVKAIRTDRWKFIRNNWDNNSEELYNLEKDPQEENNLIEKETEKAAKMRELLNKHVRESMKSIVKRIEK